MPGTLDPYRLPHDARPTRYDLRLRPSLDTATFSGTVRITIDVTTPTAQLVLNADELTISSCTVDGSGATWALEPTTERLIVDAGRVLTLGTHELAITFDGILNDKLRGFYRSTYVDDADIEHVIATTQMQATDCRRAFPCWDEPEFKAVFSVTLDIDAGLAAISNSAETSRAEAAGRAVVTFADTMPMSSYLVAFVVGELEATDPVDVDGVPLRVVHVPGKGHLATYALEVGAFCLRWFQTYYGIAYPGDKVDLVGLPDFAAGAMENLGCITFRESMLLADPATTTQNERALIADVIAHELAHMWFGDLVTMRWWNGIWLNEAFATFMEVAACDAYRPDWERWTAFNVERSTAFDTDALVSTRPVEYEVHSPGDCEGMFDVLTYQKGGALLRMLEQFLGAERFREGVSHYLRTHAYANTETSDLWDAIEATSGEPVRTMMDSWIWQPGFPIIGAELVDGTHLRLTQRRFTFVDADRADERARWVIPVAVRNGADTTTVLLGDPGVDGSDGGALLALTDPDAPVVVGAGGHGFFRIDYDAGLRARLGPATLPSLDTKERYGLVDDAWAATVAGALTPTDLVDFLDGFRDERDHTVWQAIALALRGLSRLLDDGDAFSAFQARVRALVGPALAAVGEPAEGDDDLRRKLRGLLTATAGMLGGDAGVQARCREWFDSALTDPGAVDPELVAAASAVVAATGDDAVYERVRRAFIDASTPQEQLRHLYSLADFGDEGLIVRTCELAFSGEVRTQNAPFLLRAAIANRRHGAIAWQMVSDRWDEAIERFPSNTIVRMVDAVKYLNTPALVDDAAAFFAAHPIEQAAKTLEQILERQRVNAALRNREAAAFATSLIERHPT